MSHNSAAFLQEVPRPDRQATIAFVTKTTPQIGKLMRVEFAGCWWESTLKSLELVEDGDVVMAFYNGVTLKGNPKCWTFTPLSKG